ncbi:hypothetical protein HOY82DRAFT_573653, partial [Tuber indicum]
MGEHWPRALLLTAVCKSAKTASDPTSPDHTPAPRANHFITTCHPTSTISYIQFHDKEKSSCKEKRKTTSIRTLPNQHYRKLPTVSTWYHTSHKSHVRKVVVVVGGS